MSFRNLLVVNAGGVRTITVNRPDKLNALDRDTITELKVAFGAARDDDEVRAVVLTGAGPKAFVAGADITEFSDATPVQALAFSRHGQELMTAIERLGKPSIARINGFALGGGLELALACSLRIAAATAKLGLPEINLGILPGFGGTQRLLRLAGRAATLELALTGAPVTAARALEMGIINRGAALDNLDAEVGARAGQLAASAP
ncbi:MAG: enoyl-CoA hydratase/isomerase family protein, partial [Pseudomonadota bacterium]